MTKQSERSFSPAANEPAPLSKTRADPEQVAASLEAAKVDLRLTMDAIPTIVWSHWPNGSGDFFNKSWVEYTDLSLEDSRGFGWSKALHPDDRSAYLDGWEKALATHQPFEGEARFRRADGQYRWFLVRGFPLRDEAGNIIKWYGQLTDIEDRKRSERALRQSESSLADAKREVQATLDSIPTLAWRTGPDGSAEYLNKRWLDYTGMALEQALGWEWQAAIHPDDLPKLHMPGEVEARMRRFDGEYRWFLFRSAPVQDETGRVVAWYGTNTDIEELKQTEARVSGAEAELRLALDTMPAMAWRAGPDGYSEFVNRGWLEYTDMSLEDTMGSGWASACHPDDRARFVEKFLKAVAAGTPYEDEGRFRRADGQYRWFVIRGTPFRDEAGNIVKWYGANFDIEDRKRAEARVSQTEAELRLAMDTIPALAWSAGPDGGADFVNRGWVEYANLSLEETKGSGWSSRIHPDDRDKFVDKFLKAVAAGTPYEDEGRIRRADGQYRWFLVRGTPFRDEAGNVVRWYGTCTDIEDRRRAEEALRESEQRFRDFSEASADWYWETGPDHRFSYIPEGRPESANLVNPDIKGRTRWEIAADVENEPAKWQEHIGMLNDHKPFRNFVYPALRRDGSTMYVEVSGIPRFDGNGRFIGYRGGATDVTAVVRADEAEKSLRQAQVELAHVTRLTTLGELTASIAHEVNQPLSGVIGNGAACLRWLGKDPPQFYGEVRSSIEAMISDAHRASAIIAKIRALAKNAAPQMAILDINDVIKEAVALVRRELEDHGVVLRQELSEDVTLVMGDRIQLQQVIINLTMNSIDAMDNVTERAREIVIRSSRSENHQIAVEVRDSGIGVDPAKIDSLFGAFFTTKPKGLGMGLSISRSIIEAHDGRLTFSSDGMTGATVQIALPSH